MNNKLLSNRLIVKLSLTFLGVLILAGICYTVASIYLSNNYFYETTQRLHANLAQDLIDEKFVDESPFDGDGNINKALFGDIMHDMMAVNRAIEVYLLDVKGTIRYSVVLDPDGKKQPDTQIDLTPLDQFIAQGGQQYILGDDPRNPGKKKVFSAARFNKNGQEGYIYIILAGEDYLHARDMLSDSYFLKLGLGGSILTLLFSALLGIFMIWYLTKNLREIAYAAQRFKEGDLHYRIDTSEKTDLSGVAETYNNMAETILVDIEKIKSLEKMRRELIANISHDLRTPLSIIQGYIETLQMKDGTFTPKERSEYLMTINRSSERLSKLISQLFEYSKLEANQIQPKKEPFLISELVNDIHRNYKILASEKNIDLSLEMDKTPPLVFADISLVERAIQNLMDNALKFTPKEGMVKIKIEHGPKEVEILIQDNGPGIAKEHQSLVFERYRQTKTGEEKEGAGLGLAIVRKIMDIHNSKIKVLSKPDEGTTFSFNLPIYAPSV
ncbi:MAG: ATP-binding protein [Flavobacteriaceae bacterium]